MTSNCLNCKWAKWQMTAHTPPRINRNLHGQCIYRVGPLRVPKSVDANELERLVNPFRGRVILPRAPHADCPVWERKMDDGD